MRFGGLYISHAWGRTKQTRHSSLPATIDKYKFGYIYYRRPRLYLCQILQPEGLQGISEAESSDSEEEAVSEESGVEDDEEDVMILMVRFCKNCV